MLQVKYLSWCLVHGKPLVEGSCYYHWSNVILLLTFTIKAPVGSAQLFQMKPSPPQVISSS